MFEKLRAIKPKPEVKPTKEYSPEDTSFDAQYSRAEQLNINGAKVETVLIRPKNQKTEVPVLVLPGWGATMESFKPGMKVLTEKGRPVLSLNFPRQDGNIPDSHDEEIEEWYKKRGQKYPKWPSEFLRQANTTYELLNQEYIDKVDVIAHSMAGPSVCIAAMLHPEKFIGRTIILTNSAGLIGKDSIFRLQKGAGANTSRTPTMSKTPVTEKEIKYLESTTHITPDYMAANRLRAVKEVWDISRARIDEYMLRYLKEKGIKVIIVGAVEDTMFPMEGMQKNVPGSKDAIAGFVSTIGGHMQTQVNPDKFMTALETMLPQPEKKS